MSRPPMKAFTREEAIEILEEVKELDDSIYQYNGKYLEALKMAIKALEQEPKMGEWIYHFDESGGWCECDRCHTDYRGGAVNFCPNCGADMRGARM